MQICIHRNLLLTLHQKPQNCGASRIKSAPTKMTNLSVSFENTAIVNEDGMPMMVFHATYEEFDRFDASFLGANTDGNATNDGFAQTAHLGFWFNVGGKLGLISNRVINCYLNIENPYHVDSLSDLAIYAGEEGAKQMRERLMSEGYDGIIVDFDDELGGTSFVAFSADQIVIVK